MTFIFTSDLDWNPEWAIRELIRVFKEYKVPLTLFLTHDSQVAKTEYDNSQMRRHAGVHPNFCDGSTQGNTPSQILEYCKALWPTAISYRCHRYYVNPQIQRLLATTYKYDSNLLLFLQENIRPFHDANGLMRFPVFWEDDVHFSTGLPFSVEALKPKLLTEGLKIFNFILSGFPSFRLSMLKSSRFWRLCWGSRKKAERKDAIWMIIIHAT
jgi:hypothetical protein